MILKKIFFKLMNNAVFGKTIENVRKHRDIKLVTTERRRNYLVSEPNFHTRKFFTEKLLAIEMNKTQILMNKPVYLGLSVLELSKILMYELSNLSIYYTWKNIKNITNFKYQPRHGMKNLNYLMDHILYQIFKIILIMS